MKPKALIVPHSGFNTSGSIAAQAYSHLLDCSNDFDTIFILAPSHNYDLDFIGLSSFAAWSTPLGDLEVDSEIADFLIELTTIPNDSKLCCCGSSSNQRKLAKFDRIA